MTEIIPHNTEQAANYMIQIANDTKQILASFYARKCTNALQSKIRMQKLFFDIKFVISTHGRVKAFMKNFTRLGKNF